MIEILINHTYTEVRMTESSNGITSDDKMWGLLSYLFTPIVPIIILLLEEKKNRPFIKSHYIQALAWGVASYVIISILAASIILLPLAGIAGIAVLVFNILWGIKAYQGEHVTIPVITDFVKKQNWV